MARKCLFIILLSTVIKGISSDAPCRIHETVRDPTIATNQPIGAFYKLQHPGSQNTTNCSWIFSSSQYFVLNVLFINSTFASKATGSGCNEEYVTVHQRNAVTTSTITWQPFCGQRELPDIRINGTVEIALHFKRGGIKSNANMSLTIYAELSSRDCGGIFDENDHGIPLSYDAKTFDFDSSKNIVHCAWFVKFSRSRSVHVIPTTINLRYKYYKRKCAYYKVMFSIREWNNVTGRFEDSVEACGKIDQLPKIYNSSIGNRFILSIHSEKGRGFWSTEKVEAIYFPTSEGNSNQQIADRFYQENYRFTSLGQLTQKREDSIILAKNKYVQKDLIYFLMHDVDIGCEDVMIEAWSIASGVWQKNRTISISKAKRTKLYALLVARDALLIYFRLNLSAEPKSLKVSYFTTNKVCGGVHELKPGENMTIKSPTDGNTGQYPTHTDCRWTIFTDNSTTLTISTISMELERINCDDYVDFYEGYRSGMKKIIETCKPLKKAITVKGGALIHFHSDRSVVNKGFEILISAKGISSDAPCRIHETVRDPTIATNQPIGAFYKLQHPGSQNTTNCSWIFSSSQYFVLNVLFINSTFASKAAGSGCNEQYVTVHQRNAVTTSTITWQPFCGQRQLPDIRINGTVEIVLHFKRGGIKSNANMSLTIYAELSSRDCGGIFDENDHGIPLSYDRNTFDYESSNNLVHCAWFVKFSRSRSVHVIPTTINLRYKYYKKKCAYYKVMFWIREWNNVTGRFEDSVEACGKIDQLPKIYNSSIGNRFILSIHSEKGYGFWSTEKVEAIYFPTSEGISNQQIADRFYQENYRFTSLGQLNQKREDSIILAKNKYVQKDLIYLLMHDVDIGCEDVMIEAWSIASGVWQKNRTISISKAKRTKLYALLVARDVLLIYFRLNLSAEPKSLKVSYFTTNKVCGGVHELKPGENMTITSPTDGNTGQYPTYTDCRWTIFTDNSTTLTISTISMELERINCDDYVDFYEGYRSGMKKINTACKPLKKAITVKGGALIHFHSDRSIVNKGFEILISAKGISSDAPCRIHETVRDPTITTNQPIGAFYKLQHPGSQNTTNCSWIFSSSQYFVLNVLFINSTFASKTTGSGCNKQYVTVHQRNAVTTSTITWQPFCGQRELPDIRINGTVEIVLHFKRGGIKSNANMSLTIYAELSSRDCGGIFDENDHGIPLSYNRNTFDYKSSNNLVHCVWFVKFSRSRSVHVIPTTINLRYKYYKRKCAYYKVMFSIREWNNVTGRFEDSVEACGKIDQLPKIYNSSIGNRFILSIHSEKGSGFWSTEKVEAIYFPTSEGNSNQQIADRFYQENYRFTSLGQLTQKREDSIIFAKNKYVEKDLIYFLMHDVDIGCEDVMIEAWSIASGVWQKNRTISISKAKRTKLYALLVARDALLIYFRLNLSAEPKSLKVSYFTTNKVCGGVHELKPGENMTITSPTDGNTGQYPTYTDCRWTIFTDNSTTLTISTISMELERINCDDYVDFYEGYRSGMKKINTACKPLKKAITVKGGALIHFHSDRSIVNKGFEILISAKGISSDAPCRIHETVRDPTIATNQPIGAFYKLQHPGSQNTTNCSWIFSSSQYFVLNVLFINSTFASKATGSGCNEEYVTVHQRNAVTTSTITWQPFCGQRQLPDIRINGTVEIVLHFKRGGIKSNANMSLTIYAELSSRDCGGIFDENDQGIPLSYDAKTFDYKSSKNIVHCAWFVKFSRSRSVHVIPTTIDLRRTFNQNKCAYYKEMFSIRKWNNISGRFEDSVVECGTISQLPKIYNSSIGNRFILSIHSEEYYSRDDERFEAIYFPTSEGNSKQRIADSFYQENYRFTSLGQLNQKREDSIILAKNKYVQKDLIYLLMHDVDIGCEDVMIEAWSIASGVWHKNRTISISKAERKKLYALLVAQNALLIYFRLSLSAEPKSLKVSYFTTNKICGGVHELKPGENMTIRSPTDGTAGHYPHKADCRWSIFTDNSTILNISTISMVLEPSYCFDYVDFYEGYRSGMKKIIHTCKPLKTAITVRGGALIHFHSDRSVVNKGFEILISAKGTSTTIPTTAVHKPCSGSTSPMTTTSSSTAITTTEASTLESSSSPHKPSSTKATSKTSSKASTFESSSFPHKPSSTKATSKKSSKQTGSQSKIKTYLVGILAAVAAIAFAASVAAIVIKRRRVSQNRNDNKTDSTQPKCERARHNSTLPLVDMDQLRKPSLPENAFDAVILKNTHGESIFAENPYYASNSETLKSATPFQEMSNPYYVTSQNETREPVYDCANVVENVYAEPSAKRDQEDYSYAEATPKSIFEDSENKAEGDLYDYAGNEYVL